MKTLILYKPSPRDEAEFIAMHSEFMTSGGRIHPGVLKRYDGDFTEYIRVLEHSGSGREPGRVPGENMFMKDETGRIYGMVSLRLALNDYLLRFGGHIGYGIRPSERGKGYGTAQLKLALEEMRKEGISIFTPPELPSFSSAASFLALVLQCSINIRPNPLWRNSGKTARWS